MTDFLKVPMADPAGQIAALGPEAEDAVLQVLRSGGYILGPAVERFEAEAARYCGVSGAVGVGNGTDALLISLMAMGIGPGDEVITPAFTFVATVETVVLLGATPVFVDIDPVSFTMDPTHVANRIGPRTKAILPVHLFGQAADLDALQSVSNSHGVPLLADGAQSIGAVRRGRPVAALTPLTTLSFYPTKNLGAAGDGGMVLSNDPALTERVRRVRFHGSSGTYDYQEVGVCSRLDAIQAALLSVKMRHLDAWTARRRDNAAFYQNALRDMDGIVLPGTLPQNEHTYHQFTVRVLDNRREALRAFLADRGVSSGVFYPVALHLAPAYRQRFGGIEGDHPESERACREVLSLPVHAELEPAQREHVAESIRAFFRSN